MAPPAEFKPLTYFLRPHFVYVSLAALLGIHVITLLVPIPASV